MPRSQAIAESLAEAGIATFRYNFPYAENGTGRDSQDACTATVRSAVRAARKSARSLPLLAGGHSFGGRMTSTAASEKPIDGVRGLVFFSFPLHQPGKPDTKRAEHLDAVTLPMLFLSGTRDELAKMELLKPVCAKLGGARRSICSIPLTTVTRSSSAHAKAMTTSSPRWPASFETGRQHWGELCAKTVENDRDAAKLTPEVPPMRRFTILGLMGVVLGMAVAIAALRNADDYWAGGLLLTTVMLIGVATLGACYHSGRRRAGRLGFAVFAGGYFALAFLGLSPNHLAKLPTSWLLSYVHQRVEPRRARTSLRSIALATNGVWVRSSRTVPTAVLRSRWPQARITWW